MNRNNNIFCTAWGSNESQTSALRAPPNAIELIELRSASIEHRLGYFRDEPFVIFGYCPGGGEVIWRDGHSSGFGTGGWQTFLNEIVPLAARYSVRIGDASSAGTHVLLMDRHHGAVYAAPRRIAEEFLACIHGSPPPRRSCLCARLSCATCPVRTCPMAGSASQGDDAVRTERTKLGGLKPMH
jgi:hypothetical protein